MAGTYIGLLGLFIFISFEEDLINFVGLELGLPRGNPQQLLDLPARGVVEAVGNAEVAEDQALLRFYSYLGVAEDDVVVVVGHRLVPRQALVDLLACQGGDEPSVLRRSHRADGTLAEPCKNVPVYCFGDEQKVGTVVDIAVKIGLVEWIPTIYWFGLRYLHSSKLFNTSL